MLGIKQQQQVQATEDTLYCSLGAIKQVWITHLHATALTTVVVVASLLSTTAHATATAHATSHSTSATHSSSLARVVTSAATAHAHAATAHAALLSVKLSTLHREHELCRSLLSLH